VAANVITPTAQNLATMERDMRQAVESMIREDRQMPEPRIKAGLEMVARAYDPCISCSVHVVRVP
jgi:sulfhydrogenase subunit alpha